MAEAPPPGKKRASERQLIKGEEEEEEEEEEEGEGAAAAAATAGFKQADSSVLAGRRIVKARRPGAAPAAAAAGARPASSPFAGFSLTAQPRLSAEVAAHRAAPVVVPDPPAPALPEKVAPAEAHVIEAADSGTDEVTSLPAGKAATAAAAPAVESVQQPEVVEPTSAEGGQAEKEFGQGEDAVVHSAGLEAGGVEEEDIDAGALEQAEGGGESSAAPGPTPTASSKVEAGEGMAEVQPSSFAQLSSATNAFKTSFGSGFSSTSTPFGASTAGPLACGTFPSGFSFATSVPPGANLSLGTPLSGSALVFPPLSSVFGSTNGTNAPLFGVSGTAAQATNSSHTGPPTVVLPEVPVENGEEQERVVFAADVSLFEFVDGGKWKERGKGELRLNLPREAGRTARLVMRARGNYRLLLNANLFSDMKLHRMDGREVSFACVNSTGSETPALATYAVRVKEEGVASDFMRAVEEHIKAAGSLEAAATTTKTEAAQAEHTTVASAV